MSTLEASFIPPSKQNSSTEDYFSLRSQLIKAERAQGFAGNVQTSALEDKAGDLIETLKKWEETHLHGVQINGAGHEAGHKFLHGMESSLAKSSLLEIALKAPKGALLHCHFDCILSPETILRNARKQERLYIMADVPLVSEAFFVHALPQFTVFGDALQPNESSNLFSRAYVAGSWMQYSKFRDCFPGGPDKAEEWLSSRMVLQAENAYDPRQTVDGIWRAFGRTVTVIRSLLCYDMAYREHFRQIIWKFARENILYSEIRVALNFGFSISSDDGIRQYNHREIIQILATVLEEELPKIRNAGLTFYGIKIIYACMRNSSREAMEWCINNCIDLKQAFPDLICGFDMQGQEDSGHPLSYWIPELLAMRRKCNELMLDLPFIFHAGETLDHGGETDTNLYDAILLNTKRIGHGFSITRHPLLMRICKEKKIAIETCPISNEVLGLCSTTRNHHLPILMSNCVPCSINSDDPGSWGSSPLSHDFYQALMGSNNMSLLGWRILAEWSIEYSCTDSRMKGEMSLALSESWSHFCGWIVETYGARISLMVNS